MGIFLSSSLQSIYEVRVFPIVKMGNPPSDYTVKPHAFRGCRVFKMPSLVRDPDKAKESDNDAGLNKALGADGLTSMKPGWVIRIVWYLA